MTETTMTFAVVDLNRDVLDLYFGRRPEPTFSVVFDYTDWASGEPRRPDRRDGWRRTWDWISGARRHALRLHAIRRAAWITAGCPKVPVTIRTYIPRATITTTEESA